MILTFGGGKREKETERQDSVNGSEREKGGKTESQDSCDAEGYAEVSIEAECLDKAS